MVTFKTNEVKSIGKVQISAKKLKELADKLKEARGSDENEVVEVYIVPAKEEGGVNQLAFDFSKTEEKQETVKEETVKEETKEVKENQSKPEEKTETVEPVKKEETVESKVEGNQEQSDENVQKDAAAKPEEKPQEQESKAETPEQKTESEVEKIVNNEELAQKAKEINQEAYKNGK